VFKIYKHFLKSTPEYLARYYWWAYLWKRSAWFFDHQPIINAILFGQYNKLMNTTLRELKSADLSRALQLTCVYGELTPHLLEATKPNPLHITDVAPVQLKLADSKVLPGQNLFKTRMNAEHLAYADNSFSTVIIFFLLHELPNDAREKALQEAIRVLAPNGTLLITEYAELPKSHFLYWFYPTRWVTTKLEPFLNGFWHENLSEKLNEHADKHGKQVSLISHTDIFSKFYRVTAYMVHKQKP